jgi:hypothetical protein
VTASGGRRRHLSSNDDGRAIALDLAAGESPSVHGRARPAVVDAEAEVRHARPRLEWFRRGRFNPTIKSPRATGGT